MSDVTDPSPERPSKKATLRLDQRLLTRLSYAFVLMLVLIFLPVGYRVYLNFKSQRDITIGRNNLLNLYKALATYAQDWDGRLPPSERWAELAAGYLHAPPNTPGGAMSYLRGPGDGEDIGYVYNEAAAGYNLEPTNKDDRQKDMAPNELVLLVEKVGAKLNEHALLPRQKGMEADKLGKHLDFPHFTSDPKGATSLVVLASGRIEQRTKQDFQTSP